jgi:hypothetical protein
MVQLGRSGTGCCTYARASRSWPTAPAAPVPGRPGRLEPRARRAHSVSGAYDSRQCAAGERALMEPRRQPVTVRVARLLGTPVWCAAGGAVVSGSSEREGPFGRASRAASEAVFDGASPQKCLAFRHRRSCKNAAPPAPPAAPPSLFPFALEGAAHGRGRGGRRRAASKQRAAARRGEADEASGGRWGRRQDRGAV